MSFLSIQSNVYYFSSSVNIGYIHKDGSGLLIDAGIDSSSVKKVLRELDKQSLPLTHLFITHAHADHYGGAAYLQQHYQIHTIAPVFEEAILKEPGLEPLYLFGGNDPVEELHNKFLKGPAVRIDEVVEEGVFLAGDIEGEAFLLPGHSYHQLAVRVEGVLFAADGYFSEETLNKHKIPYITDAFKTLESLHRLKSIECEGSLPGHGVFEKNPLQTIEKNIVYHKKLLDWLYHYIKSQKETGITHEQAVAAMCRHYKVGNLPLSQWLLYRTAVTAYLLGLKREKRISDGIIDHRWTFYSLSDEEA